ncbi:MAG: isochorismate synthase [Gordonia sp. (in: high G+C Gram-positive bacteria)]
MTPSPHPPAPGATVRTHRTGGHRPGSARDLGFLLCRHRYHVTGGGRVAEFSSPPAAASALASGAVPAVVGAIPFDTADPAALFTPARIAIHRSPWHPELPVLPTARIAHRDPTPEEHRARVAATVTALSDPATDLAKVVLARSLTVRTDAAVTGTELAAALRRADPRGSVFLTDLSPAGGAHLGARFVGASPEVLIRKQGTTISAHPLAGSAARSADPAVDARRGRELGASTKDLAEHRYVVDALRTALRPLCASLDIPDSPQVMTTPAMWHLGTPIRGEVADSSLTALDLALAVHPTPAICGTPTAAAREYILRTEGERGFYAGAVGWARRAEDGTGGDGEWMVSIRCAEIAPDGRSATTWAGGGIVAASDPDAEVRETEAKFATILRTFGLA